MTASRPELVPLDAFVGEWRTEGEVHATADQPAERFHATDAYEWLPGSHFLLHRWDARMPFGQSRGIEVIGLNGSGSSYFVHSYDDEGNVNVFSARFDGGVWRFEGETMRYSGMFSDGGRRMSGEWELREDEDGEWREWMSVELTRVA